MKILFVSVSCPFPTTGGGAQRTAMLLRGLQSVAETHLFLLQDKASVAEQTKQHLIDQYNLVGMKPTPRPRREKYTSLYSTGGANSC